MSLSSGTILGPYEIQNPIDAGGMGEVYLARDTRLGRSVAVKVLPDGFAGDSQRRERFSREARALSSLAHPNICRVFDVGSSDGIDFLVMEHLEGTTLETRLMQGAMPLSEILSIGSEIASALDAAHRQHIIHRDVKPSNIMLTHSGSKLLDFGLMKETPRGFESTTLSLTAEGSAPGTLAYMSPEQLSGEADARSDIWSLGTVLYEMATGRPPHEGRSRAELSASILTRDPDLAAVSNAALRHTIERCLSRDPESRWQSAADVGSELRWIARDSLTKRRLRISRSVLGRAVAVLALAAAAIAGWVWLRNSKPESAARLSVALPAGAVFLGATVPSIAISPDGNRIVFRVLGENASVLNTPEGTLYMRALDQFEPTVLTQSGGPNPEFSPDGSWLAYVNNRRLMKIRTTGGPAYELSEFPGAPRGISWSTDGSIYFAKSFGTGLTRVSADGSGEAQLTTPDRATGENSHRWPHVLPDGRHVLFTVRTGQMTSFDDARIAVVSLDTGRWQTVLDGGSDARYLPTGHLVFMQRGSLMGVLFDSTTLTTRGSPVALVNGIFWDPSTGAGQYSIAGESGTLAYIPGGVHPKRTEFLRVNREGGVTARWTVPKTVDTFHVSPDSKRIALQVSAANDDVWTYDIEREALSRVSSASGDELNPSWSPDGNALIFGGQGGLFLQRADGSGEPEFVASGNIGSPEYSPDGATLAYVSADPDTGADIWLARADGRGTPVLFAGTPHSETSPRFSPDGRWIAYVSEESGQVEVYLRPVSGGSRLQISAGGGALPRWSRDGRSLFYRFGDEFFSVTVSAADPPMIGKPRLMFRLSWVRNWDVIDNEFVVLTIGQARFMATSINIVPNFFEEVKSRLPSR